MRFSNSLQIHHVLLAPFSGCCRRGSGGVWTSRTLRSPEERLPAPHPPRLAAHRFPPRACRHQSPDWGVCTPPCTRAQTERSRLVARLCACWTHDSSDLSPAPRQTASDPLWVDGNMSPSQSDAFLSAKVSLPLRSRS
ncbi:hypothetical protein TGCAST_389840 [Toxoplasma gondii CAST]|uniref:Uncharacterized protein n=1 Tax=Toxoplasma gondii CAST TaxID=943122 RepID=A0A425HLX4_TOXGO|nr:hypothetical protein TGCAST_389840 [Toxoplasma gondii CAST]